MSLDRIDSAVLVDPQNPWPGLASFDESAQNYFFGREPEALELFRLIKRAPLTLLFGQSGLGKTSLLRAGVFPRLRAADFFPLYLRLDQKSAGAGLREQLADAFAQAFREHQVEGRPPEPGETLWEYFHRKDTDFWSRKQRLLTPVLVLDQLEEFFTHADSAGGSATMVREFFLELADLAQNRVPASLAQRLEVSPSDAERFDYRKDGCRIVLSLREDFLPHLENLRGLMPSLGVTRIRLTEMSGAQACDAVQKPGSSLLEPGVAEQIVRLVAGDDQKDGTPLADLQVEPTLLSVVCRELNTNRIKARRSTIGPEMISQTGRQEIIARFYEDALADLPVRVRIFIEDQLVMGSGYRDSVALENILSEGEVTEAEIRLLVNRRLLRIDDRFRAPRVELVHDVLTDVISNSRALRRQREAEDADRREKERAAAERLRTRRRKFALASAALGLILLCASSIWLWRRGEMHRREAQIQALISQARASLPLDPEASIGFARQAALVEKSSRVEEILRQALFASRLRHRAEAKEASLSVALSDGSRFVAGVDRLGNVSILDTQGDLPSHNLSIGAPPDRMTLSPGAEWMFVTRGANSAELWHARTGDRRNLEGHSGPITHGGFSLDAKWIATSSWDESVRIWNVETGMSTARLIDADQRRVAPTCASFSADGSFLVIGSLDGSSRIWVVADGSQRTKFHGHREQLNAVAFSPDGRSLVTASEDGTARIWDVKISQAWNSRILRDSEPDSRYNRAILPHGQSVQSAAFSPDSRFVVTASRDFTVRVWHAANGQSVVQFRSDDHPFAAAGFDPTGQFVVAVTERGKVKIWDAGIGRTVAQAPGPATGSAVANDGRTILASGKLVALNPFRTEREFRLPSGRVVASALSPNGHWAALAADDGLVHIWNAQTGSNFVGAPSHRSLISTLEISPDSDRLAVGGTDGAAFVFEFTTARQVPLNSHTPRRGSIAALAFNPAGDRILVASDTGLAEIFEVQTGTVLRTLAASASAPLRIAGAAIGAQNAFLMTETGELLTFAVATSELTRTTPLKGNLETLSTAAFSPDARFVVTTSPGSASTRIWEVSTGNHMIELKGHADVVTSARFAPDGRSVATSSKDGSTRLYTCEETGLLNELLTLAEKRSPH